MKIQFTRHLDLVDLSRTVLPGDVLESPTDAPEEVLRGYVRNEVAREIPGKPAKLEDPKNTDGGE